jgi:hypothetical protein
MDFRFVEVLRAFLDREGMAGDVDVLSWPGGAACLAIDDEREHALQALALARRVHRCDKVVLAVHEDCLRLGGSAAHRDAAAEATVLRDHLRAAAREVRASIPGLEPRLVILRASGAVDELDAG